MDQRRINGAVADPQKLREKESHDPRIKLLKTAKEIRCCPRLVVSKVGDAGWSDISLIIC